MQIANIHTLKEINHLQNKPTQKTLEIFWQIQKGIQCMHVKSTKNDIIG